MKKTKKIAIIFALILLIGASAFAAVYYLTDIFRTPEDMFYKYMGKAAQLENNYTYQEMLEELKASKDNSYKSETEIGVELKSAGRKSRETQAIYNELSKVKLNINSNVKPSENKATYDIGIKYSGFNVGNFELVKDNDLYGLNSSIIDDKYIAVRNKNLKELFAKFGEKTSNIPDKIETIDAYDLLYVSPEDQQKIKETYKNIFKNNISSQNFQKIENVTQKINGEDINTTGYSLSLSEKDFYNVMIEVFKTLRDDETILSIIEEKYNKLFDNSLYNNEDVDFYSSYSLPSKVKTKKSKLPTKITKSELIKGIDNLISEFESEINYAGDTTAQIIVYVANGDVAKVELKTGNEVKLAAEFYKKDDVKHTIIYIAEVEKSYSYRSIPELKYELKKVMELETKSVKDGDSKTQVGSFTIFDDDEKKMTVSFDITTKGEIGKGVNETSGKITFDVEDISAIITTNSKVEYTDDVNVKSINSNNANILNDMTEKEIQEYFENMTKGFEETLVDLGIVDKNDLPSKTLIEEKTQEETLSIEENNSLL